MEIFEEKWREKLKKTKWLCKERQADAITALLEKSDTVYNIRGLGTRHFLIFVLVGVDI